MSFDENFIKIDSRKVCQKKKGVCPIFGSSGLYLSGRRKGKSNFFVFTTDQTAISI